MARVRPTDLTRVELAFLQLLRAGLWSTTADASGPFPLSTEEWQQLWQLARKQTVEGLVFKGLSSLPPQLLPPEQLRWTWMAAMANIEVGYQQAITAMEESHRLLTSMGADGWLQKGLAVACYYDEPEHRVNGDIDWFVISSDASSSDFLSVIGQRLTEQGSDVCHRADDSIAFEIHDTEIELHPRLFDLSSSRGQRIEAELLLEEAPDQLSSLGLGSSLSSDSINIPGPLTTLLLLSAHILKHVTTKGIGLRQFCDMARAYYALHDHYDTNQLNDLYGRLRLQRWHQLLQDFLFHVLETPANVLPAYPLPPSEEGSTPTPDVQRLLRSILQWGNFGQDTEAPLSLSGKFSTVAKIITRIPFAMRYAPRETLSHIGQLMRGQRER